MKKIFSISSLVGCIVAILLALSFSPGVFASTTTQNGMSGCSHLSVQLNGTRPATENCLDRQLNTGRMSPKSVTTGCGSPSLILWWDGGFSGFSICFSGSGATDLTSYAKPSGARCSVASGPNCTSWNDNASSYEITGRSAVTIYPDIGQGGSPTFERSTFSQGNLGSTPIGNDRASSVLI